MSQVTTYQIRWSDLGCPQIPGVHHWNGHKIMVRKQKIEAARGNPDAICTILCAPALVGGTRCSLTAIDPET
jgi:hypothetical protein